MKSLSEITVDELIEEKVFVPTLEQQAILRAGTESNTSLMLIAMAGCSKSTTLELLARALPKVPTCCIVFNKKNQLEAVKKFTSSNGLLSKFGSAQHVNIVTANGLGHGAWGRAIGKRLTLNTRKIGEIVKKELPRDSMKDDFVLVCQLVSKARHSGLVPKSYSVRGLVPDEYSSWEDLDPYSDINEEIVFVARKVLHESIRQAYSGLIDFDDQIYMSALFGGVFPRYPVVMVDESQDLSPLNHIQIKRTAGDRLIVVGDPRQAIYAFRGADSSSMDNLRTLRNEWIDLPLSTTFRCPRRIVSRQQSHAPGFNAHSSNLEGEVIHAQEWSIKDYLNSKPLAILCRNNAPILSCALKLIRRGIGCTVLGGELGKSLVNLGKKIVPDENTPRDEAIRMIQDWATREINLAYANGKDAKVEVITDKAECLLAVFKGTEAVRMAGVNKALQTMFSKENLQITLSTGHKAKGLEWPTVIHLDPWRIPSKYAKSQAQNGNSVALEQDMNLKYVIETRAQERLILADLENLQ